MKKLVKKLRFAVVEGVKGAIPWGSSAVNIVENFTGKDLATGEPVKPKQVSWEKIAMRTIALLILAYLVAKDIIPVKELIDLLKSVI
jgi:hypothetical protein